VALPVASTPVLAPAVLKVILYEGVGASPLAGTQRAALVRALLEKGYAVSCVRPGGALTQVKRGVLLVLGRFGDGKPADGSDASGQVALRFADIAEMDVDGVLALAQGVRDETQAAKAGAWKPWFPVIDYDRCTNCMQCLSFCLFDVYAVDANHKIKVQKESNCKTDCPACSRVCPEVAILFPKYRNGPINGDEINSEDLRREAMKVDISALLGGDIYSALRDRSAKAKSRFSKERDEDRALKERQRCLTKLAEKMDIPAEVLAALPSMDQIAAKAAEAKAKAEAALNAQS
jgi:Pyruvate/2-oxoacid:ferredoxin oxidoreductase delta subunit